MSQPAQSAGRQAADGKRATGEGKERGDVIG